VTQVGDVLPAARKKKFCFTKLVTRGFEHSWGYPLLDKALNEATRSMELGDLQFMFSSFGLSLEAGTCQIQANSRIELVFVVFETYKKPIDDLYVHKLKRSGDNHLHVCDRPVPYKKLPNHFHFRMINPGSTLVDKPSYP
jgi:hypothetical protein